MAVKWKGYLLDQNELVLDRLPYDKGNSSTVKRKRRYLKKETLGKNLVRGGNINPRNLRYLDQAIGEVYDINKEIVAKHQDTMKKLDELFHEFTDDPKAFVEKYAKLDDNDKVLEYLEKNPRLFEGRYWT